MRCLECGGKTRARRRQAYKYIESGLSNVVLNGVTVHTCENCRTQYPELPAIQKLHNAIARAILTQETGLRGEEVRFLRKQMGIKATDFAEMLGVTKVAVSRWENSRRPLPPVTDRLIRCVFLLYLLQQHLPQQRTPGEIRAFLEQFWNWLPDIRRERPPRPRQIDIRRELAVV